MKLQRLASHKEISLNIRNCREAQDMTREELAQKLSTIAGYAISYGWVRRIEVDWQTPTIQYLPLLNEALGIPEDDPFRLLQPGAFAPNDDYRYRKRRQPRRRGPVQQAS